MIYLTGTRSINDSTIFQKWRMPILPYSKYNFLSTSNVGYLFSAHRLTIFPRFCQVYSQRAEKLRYLRTRAVRERERSSWVVWPSVMSAMLKFFLLLRNKEKNNYVDAGHLEQDKGGRSGRGRVVDAGAERVQIPGDWSLGEFFFQPLKSIMSHRHLRNSSPPVTI